MTRAIYILGAGFSASCGIATDANMLEALNPLLDDTPPPKSPSTSGTYVDYIRRQMFFDRAGVGFETFMSALNSQTFLSEAINPNGQNIFQNAEEEIVTALRKYLNEKVDIALKNNLTHSVEFFAERVNWDKDVVITFNYDLLLEKVLEKKQITPSNEIIHLHGSLAEPTLVYPNSRKFTNPLEKQTFSKRWKDAFDYLRGNKDAESVSDWIFIGYSMPATDAEAMGLFAYADFYNSSQKYHISVVNPDSNIIKNYAFFRKPITYHRSTLESYLENLPGSSPNVNLNLSTQ